MTTPPEGDVEGPIEPIPGGQPEGEPQPWMPMPGTYGSRNAGRRQSILEAFQKIANIDDVNGAVGDVHAEVHNLGVVVADYGNALERKVEPWAVPTVAPLSQTINRRADATFQLGNFMTPGGWTGTPGGGDTHRHPLGIAGGADWSLAEGWTEGNRTYVAFITPTINRAYEEINFMVGAVSGTPANLDIAIYVTGEDRVLRRQVGPIRVSDVIGIGRQLVTVPFSTWIATQGSYIAVAVRQHAEGSQRPLLGLNDTPRPLTNVVFPRKITAYRHTSTSSLPATLHGETDLDFEQDWFVPYIELSEAVGVDYRSFTESWGHGSVAPRPWVPLTSRGIYSATGNVGQTYASHNGVTVSMYDTPLSTDFVRVRTSITRFWPPLASTDRATKSATIIIRGTNDLRSGLGLRIHNQDGYSLISWTDMSPGTTWNDRPTIASFPLAPATGQQIEIDYLDGDVVVRIDGVVRLEVTVSDPLGASCRFLGLQFDRDSTFINTYRSSWLGPWSARDLPQADGGGDDDGGEGGGED